jgi:serine/threonine-protein kinase
MAPEEFVRGAWIDQASNVYTLGRYAINALCVRIDEGWRAEFPAGDALADVMARATQLDRQERFPTVREFVEAFLPQIKEESRSETCSGCPGV